METHLMGASKTHQYSATQRSFAATAKAIGHPARVAIVQYLSDYGLATNIDLIRVTDLVDSTVNQHLAELRGAGIIDGHYVGDRHYYRLTNGAEKAVKNLNQLFRPSNIAK
jgi:DNA-binding transcriptional ArsR family regulator